MLRAAIRNMVELEMVVVGGEKQGREKEGGRRGSLRRGHDARCWNVGRRRAQSFPLLKLDGVFLIFLSEVSDTRKDERGRQKVCASIEKLDATTETLVGISSLHFSVTSLLHQTVMISAASPTSLLNRMDPVERFRDRLSLPFFGMD